MVASVSFVFQDPRGGAHQDGGQEGGLGLHAAGEVPYKPCAFSFCAKIFFAPSALCSNIGTFIFIIIFWGKDDILLISCFFSQELRPTLDELGISTPEELGYHEPELALPNPYNVH